MDALFQFFFKYRPIVFEQGRVVFDASWLVRLVVVVAAAVSLAAVFTSVRMRARRAVRDRWWLGGIRTLAVVLLAVLLLHPALLVSTAVPQRNVVGVVVDDSRSMRVPDMDGRTRADVVRSLLAGSNGSLYRALARKFVVRFYRLSDGGSRVTGLADLAFDGTRTRIAPALDGVRQELAGVPVAGLVLVSDGADNASDSLTQTLLSLNARRLPVFTVGMGQEHWARDIEVRRVDAPREVLEGASLVVSIEIAQRGFGGRTVQLVAEDSGHIVNRKSITLPSGGEVTTARVRIPTSTPGAHLLTFRIAPEAGEMVTRNNARSVLVAVRNRRDKILYIEGEPRFELKFVRMAVDQDPNLQLVTMLRTAKDRFLRLGVDDSLELVAGFPRTREELYAYRGIVLGSIEASFFTLDQLRMIADFVSQRGGGLLMLGGRKSFAEGGYAGTPLADVLPVQLPADRNGKPAFHQVQVSLTPAGAAAAAMLVAGSDTASAARWKHMPVVTSMNQVTRAKPGATTLLTGTAPGSHDHGIVLAYQRYGHGKAFAFPIQDSWQWQMDAKVPVGDPTYRTFWRQMLRWLVSDVPGRVTVTTATDQTAPGEPVQLNAQVTDKQYLALNSAQVTAAIHGPEDSVRQLPLEWSVTRDGAYHAAFTPSVPGVYRVQVTARSRTDTVMSDPTFVRVGDIATEAFGAEQHAALLRRIAEETGGRYYTAANAGALANDLVYSASGNTVVQRLDLWDMPILLIVLLGLLVGEWGYRRARGWV
ncbi:MAG TPA: glutamine amidotransferase [Gemmatimonadaceae bacterium]|nr:glutamine amidotransferase [Gemmatimonadaceae bacterium]